MLTLRDLTVTHGAGELDTRPWSSLRRLFTRIDAQNQNQTDRICLILFLVMLSH